MEKEYAKIAKLILDRTVKDPTTAARVILGLCQTINSEFTHMSSEEADRVFKEEWSSAELVKETSISDNAEIKHFYSFDLRHKTKKQRLHGSGYHTSKTAVLEYIKEKYSDYTIIVVQKLGS